MKCPPEEEEDTAAAGAADLNEKEVSNMPGFDGTGPVGAGPMTGGGRGRCNPSYPGYSTGYGRGFGFGRRHGRGVRRGFGAGAYGGRGYGRGVGGVRPFFPVWDAGYAPPYGPFYGYAPGMSPDNEIRMLKDQAEAVKRNLEHLNRRIEELESESSES